VSVRDRIDELYELPPEEFVGRRDALVKELRTESQDAEAADVKSLRRPTVGAWAINQVARGYHDDVEELLEVGRQLRGEQQKVMTGKGRSGVHEVGARRRAVVDRLTRMAGDVLEAAGRGSGSHLEEIADTFLAASVEEEVATLVEAGRLDRERKPSTDLGAMLGFAGVSEDLAEGGQGTKRGATRDRASERDAIEQRAAIEALERQARRARQEADHAAKRAEEARRAASTAKEVAERRARAAREAEKAAAASLKEAESAKRKLERLRRG
jgi:hypothetical protein